MRVGISEPEESVLRLAQEFESGSAAELIDWVFETYGSNAAICTSFQAEGMVILDMAGRLASDIRVFTIDTGRMPTETYDLIDRVRDRYNISIEVNFPDQSRLEAMTVRHGVNAFYRGLNLRLLCCEVRKVEPLNRALAGLDLWVTGLRRTQVGTRAGTPKIELDKAHGSILKVNPLADWSEQKVWDYIKANDVPYNKLYDQGYTSIGCAPCTRPTQPGEDARAGRWWWESSDVPKECGMHYAPSSVPSHDGAGSSA